MASSNAQLVMESQNTPGGPRAMTCTEDLSPNASGERREIEAEESSPLFVLRSIFFFCCKGMIEGIVVFLFIWLLIQVLLNKHQEVHLQVLLGAGLALLCFCLFLGCALCWRHGKRRNSSNGKGRGPDDPVVDLALAVPPKTNPIPIRVQYQEMDGEVLGGAPATEVGSPGAGGGFLSPPRSSRHARGSMPSLSCTPKLSLYSKTKRALERRCTVSGDSLVYNEHSELVGSQFASHVSHSHTLPSNLSGMKPKQRPLLHFTLFYSQAEATLTVTVIGVSSLPKRMRTSCDSYVKVYLLPKFIEPRQTALRRKSLNPEFRETFQFGTYSMEQLQGFALRLAVYVREFHSLRDSYIGEVLFPCSQGIWNPDEASGYTRELSSTKTKLKKCLSSLEVFSAAAPDSQPLGQLFLVLQYQALANRIKVMVRKAEHLGRLTRIPGAPDHYVVIHLYQDGRVCDTKETKSVAGYSPVWNAPFLFDVPSGNIQEQRLCLEFTVMQIEYWPIRFRKGRTYYSVPDVLKVFCDRNTCRRFFCVLSGKTKTRSNMTPDTMDWVINKCYN